MSFLEELAYILLCAGVGFTYIFGIFIVGYCLYKIIDGLGDE